ncbi:MAG: hypothetical protein ABI833_17545, partial [Acidobacteriota bacterium]
LAAILAILMASNILTLNQYLYQFVRFGGAGSWDDAMFALSNKVPSIQADEIFAADWGIFNSLTTLNGGQLPLQDDAFAFTVDNPPEFSQRLALESFARKNSIWVTRTTGNEMFPGANARLEKMASADGYRKIELGQVLDRNHRPVFEIFRIVPSPAPWLPLGSTLHP